MGEKKKKEKKDKEKEKATVRSAPDGSDNHHYLANFDSHRCCGSHWLHWKWLTVVGKRMKWWICHRLSSSGVLSDVRPWEANLIDKQLCDKSGRGSTTHKTVDQCAKTVNDVIFICSLFLAIFCGILVDNEWYFGEKGSSTSASKEEVPPHLGSYFELKGKEKFLAGGGEKEVKRLGEEIVG